MEIYDGFPRKALWKGSFEYLVAILNSDFYSRADVPNVGWDFLLTGRKDAKTTKEVFVAFCATLRLLADQWIDSGKHGSGDHPHERIIPLQDLKKYLVRNPPQLTAKTPSGPLRLTTVPFLFKQSDPSLAARDAATYQFLQLMDWPDRSRLSRCYVCRGYFMRARLPKKDKPIYNGVFCKEHKGKGGAARTFASRERRNQQMVELAAEWWLKWNPTRHGERSKWVADKVNQKLHHWASHITGKWVTQNQKKIEAEVERRNRAKS